MAINFESLKDEYLQLFASCKVTPSSIPSINRLLGAYSANNNRYAQVSKTTGVPPSVVFLIHCLEANLDFGCHLHNGDPLTQRTYHVPADRPKKGYPPFTWEESAADALLGEGFCSWNWQLTGIAGILYKLESYNGWGYRLYHPNCLSPYLWSKTNHYSCGKYVADGQWDACAPSGQIGAAAILRVMVDRRLVSTDRLLQVCDPPLMGDDVGKVQLALRDHNIRVEHANKVYDAATEIAVVEFQNKNNLLGDGVVGPLTRKALGL